MNFGMILRRTARTFPANIAVRFEGRDISYAELYERSCRLANTLLGLGLESFGL
jgi:acyl-CoA synthetase (AMP-forming)/AMP-acid ligase II